MPSGHAAIISGLFVWFVLELLINNWTIKSLFRDKKGKFFIIAILFCVMAPTGFSRIHLRYHTWEQVLVGTLLGAFIATTYFLFLFYVLADRFDDVLKHPMLVPFLDRFPISNHYPKRKDFFSSENLVKIV